MNKKDKILLTALEYFSNEGFDSVSTSKIAIAAEVSEGLIFRHFKSKRGLLEEIIKLAEIRIGDIFSRILQDNDPIKVVEDIIDVVFNISEEEYDFWRLQLKLKWHKGYCDPDHMTLVQKKLTWAFDELQFPNSEMEADLLVRIMESMATGILQEGLESQYKMRDYLKSKYVEGRL